VNASQRADAGLSQGSGFHFGCLHSACADRDRLDFVEGLLEQGLLIEADLTNPEFLAPEAEGEEGELTDEEFDAEVVKLAKMSSMAYERVRKKEAERLNVRASVLDREVARQRPDDGCTPGQGRPIAFPDVEPWGEPVEGDDLLREMTEAIEKYIVMPTGVSLVVALWAIHTYVFDLFTCTPRLAITAPTKGCAKTLLLDVLGALVQRAFTIMSPSSATIYRTVEATKPTILLDEADRWLLHNEELIGVFNYGHRRGGDVPRCVGSTSNMEPRLFSVFAPCAIAMIGSLPGTLEDRAVHARMKKKTRHEKTERFNLGRNADLGLLARKAARWAQDNADALRDVDPKIPDEIFNREGDNWRPLFAIADVVGGDWPKAIRATAMGGSVARESDSQLLEDIRYIFKEKSLPADDTIPSKALVSALVALEDRPWGDVGHGRPLDPHKLAKWLKEFDICSKVIRPAVGKVYRGYKVADFKDAFERYLKPDAPDPGAPCPGMPPNGDRASSSAEDDPSEADDLQDESVDEGRSEGDTPRDMSSTECSDGDPGGEADRFDCSTEDIHEEGMGRTAAEIGQMSTQKKHATLSQTLTPTSARYSPLQPMESTR
jgi:putative DNA primase/helicase